MRNSDTPKKNTKDQKSSDEEQLSIGGWNENFKLPKKKFSGPESSTSVELRVAFKSDAYADFIAHARSSLEVEICGVLVGMVYKDSHGLFVEVDAIIQGDSARHGNTHVTFTQETWTKIHQTLERNYSDKKIVGWYHTHPGFGVEFSEMDMFIQNNFFSLPSQIALLTDPLSGEVAICISEEGGPILIDRFWVNGREMRCTASKKKPLTTTSRDQANTSAIVTADIEILENKLNQYIQRADENQQWFHATIMFISLAVLSVILFFVGHSIYRYYTDDGTNDLIEMVEMLRTTPVPVQIDGQTYIFGVQIVKMHVPPEVGNEGNKQTQDSGLENSSPLNEERVEDCEDD